jgi:hypothetical protein
MSRHACVIRNVVFLKIYADLQRPEDWEAGGRETGEIAYIKESKGSFPVLPFYSPFYFIDFFGTKIIDKFLGFYTKYIINRGDNTLFLYILKNISAKLHCYVKKQNNLFSSEPLILELESGRMDGNTNEKKYYRMPKKDFSKRYSTNCLSAIFEPDEPNTISIDDLREYADIMASKDELLYQNSHFQSDIQKQKNY